LAAGAADDDDAHARILVEPFEDAGELVAHGHRHRVHLRLPVDPQRGHRPRPFDAQELAHGITRTLPLFRRSSTCCTAARASFKGNARSTTGFVPPSTTQSAEALRSPSEQ